MDEKRDLFEELERFWNHSVGVLRREETAVFAKVRAALEDGIATALSTHLGADLAAAVGRVDVDAILDGKTTLRAEILARIDVDKLSTDARALLEQALKALGSFAGLVVPDKPIVDQPFVKDLRDRAQVTRVAGAAGLSAAERDALLAVAPRVSAIDPVVLRALVDRKTLARGPAAALGLAVTVRNLIGDDKIGERVAAALAGSGKRSLADLATLPHEQWVAVLAGAGVKNAEGTATRGQQMVARAFPSAAMTARLAPITRKLTEGNLLARALAVVAKQPSMLQTGELPAGDDGPALAALRTAVRAYPTLGIGEIATSGTGKLEERAAQIRTRIARFEQVRASIPALDRAVLTGPVDKWPVDWGDVTGADRAAIAETLRAQQRLLALSGGDPDTAAPLMLGGYGSAFEVAGEPAEVVQQRTGLGAPAVASVLKAAGRITVQGAQTLLRMRDVFQGRRFLGPTGGGSGLDDYLRDLPGLDTLFGDQAQCHCEHCRSVLGPAAYFVDLMCSVRTKILDTVFAGRADTHPLSLEVRRPDLWTLPLDCKNTLDEVPTLVIVLEVLEGFIARGNGDIDIYAALLPAGDRSFRQPFERHRVEIDESLVALGGARAEIVRVLNGGTGALTRAELGLSPAQAALLTATGSPDLAALGRRYGLSLQTAAGGVLTPVDLQDLIRATEIDRDGIAPALHGTFVSARGAELAAIAWKDPSTQDQEVVNALTAGVLDRLHRFVRLTRHTGWTVLELDAVLDVLLPTPISAPGIGDDVLGALAQMRELQGRLGIGVELACALVASLPRQSVDESPTGMQAGLFDPSVLRPGAPIVHPAFGGGDLRTVAALRRGCGIDDASLVAWLAWLVARDGAATSAGFDPTWANLARLFKHAQLPGLLNVSVSDCQRLLALIGGPITDRQRLRDLMALHDTWRASRLSLDELELVMGAGDATTKAGAIADRVLAIVSRQRALFIPGTALAVVGPLTEEQSRTFLAACPQLQPVEGAADGALRWRDGARREDLVVPDALGSPVVRASVAATVTAAHPGNVLGGALAEAVGWPRDAMEAWLDRAGVDRNSADLAIALRAPTATEPLLGMARALVPAIAILRGLGASDLPNLISSASAVGLPLTALTEPTLRQLSALKEILAAPQDTSVANLVAPARLTGGHLAAEVVGAALGVDADQARSLAGAASGSSVLEVLTRARDIQQLCGTLGAGPATLAAIAAETNAAEAAAADLLASVALRTTDTATNLTNRLNEIRRDALADHLLHTPPTDLDASPFRTTDDLVAYFLVDVEAGGCASTTRVASAISTVQTYIQRCLFGLEQDRRTDDRHLVVTLDAAFKEEWQAWRRSYRVWEANRKVLLYPENYLDPSIRDDATPLFRALEDALNQRPVDDQSVLDAYAAYMEGLQEIASLEISGAYHDIADGADVLHLFGVTPGDPPVHYYRRVENIRSGGTSYGPWNKVDLGLPARKLSPVVVGGRLYVFAVAITTRSRTTFSSGGSVFQGYTHTMSLRYSSQRLDGSWTSPQSVELHAPPGFSGGPGVVLDPPTDATAPGPVSLLSGETQTAAQDGYTLRGVRWDRVHADVRDEALFVTGRDFAMRNRLDLRRRVIASGSVRSPGGGVIRRMGQALDYVSTREGPMSPNAVAAFGAAEDSVDRNHSYDGMSADPDAQHQVGDLTAIGLGQIRLGILAREDAGVVAVSRPHTGTPASGELLASVIIQSDGKPFLLFEPGDGGGSYALAPLGTSLVDKMAQGLFDGGLNGLLDLTAQQSLAEAGPAATLSLAGGVRDRTGAGTVDFDGPFGTYLREVYLHVPLLIAGQLRAQGNHLAALRFFHYLFDPTASDQHVWRNRELAGLTPESLLARLSDSRVLDAYSKHPFNPHAIARLYPAAYAKAIVLRYVDHLLDWADELFTEFTRESVDEAIQLYLMARDVLGNRPPQLGDCDVAGTRTFSDLTGRCRSNSSVLITVENDGTSKLGASPSDPLVLQPPGATPDGTKSLTKVGVPWNTVGVTGWNGGGSGATPVWSPSSDLQLPFLATLATSIADLLFCVPENAELTSRWDRIDDRLYKLRHCLDIDGVPRKLEPFGAPLDPRLLIEQQEPGVTADGIAAAAAAELPPYRFAFFIDRAKGYAAMLSGLGGALLGAMERRDGEQLSRLRNTHGKNLLALGIRAREQEIQAAEEAIASLEIRRQAAEGRRDFYRRQLATGLSIWEALAETGHATALVERGNAQALYLGASIASLIPRMGSPWAMVFGGEQLGPNLKLMGDAVSAVGAAQDLASDAASRMANYARRAESWGQQLEQSEFELSALERDLAGANVRLRLAQRSLQMHEETIKQADAIIEFYGNKLAGLPLYTYMQAQLARLYREAYRGALGAARMAERAFRFERDIPDTDPTVVGDHWEPGFAGMLAGERLMADLVALEQRFLATNHRTFEVDQSFALSQIAPEKLVSLQTSGTCEFELKELFFDLAYPGQYRRKIRAVRLTIPAIVGPYTSVSATLTCTQSWIRLDPNGALTPIPPQRTTQIATSSAQNDGGVFELSFRDERYAPFEGLGAAGSTWRLRLPSAVPAFDYTTIDDVIVHVAYTALASEDLRTSLEDSGPGAGNIRSRLTGLTRVISLRREHSAALSRLISSPPGTPVTFSITAEQFPFFIRQFPFAIDIARLLIRSPRPGAGLVLAIDGSVVTPGEPYLGLPSVRLPSSFGLGDHVVEVRDAGALAATSSLPGDPAALDAEEAFDLLFDLEVSVS